MVLLGLLALLGINQGLHASGYRDISTPRQNYPVMAKYDSNGILRYCDGKRRGKPVGGKKMLTRQAVPTKPIKSVGELFLIWVESLFTPDPL